MVSGFLSSTSGSIELDGRDITRVPQHEIAGMGLVRTFQLVQLFNGMSVAENVEVGCHLATKGGVTVFAVTSGLVPQAGDRGCASARWNCSTSSALGAHADLDAELLPLWPAASARTRPRAGRQAEAAAAR